MRGLLHGVHQRVRRLLRRLEYALRLRENAHFAAPQRLICAAHLLRRLADGVEGAFLVPAQDRLSEMLETQRLALDLERLVLQPARQLFLLVEQTASCPVQLLQLPAGIAAVLFADVFLPLRLLLLHLGRQTVDLLLRRRAFLAARALFLLAAVDLRLKRLAARPLHKERLELSAPGRVPHLSVQLRDLVQRGELFLLPLRHLLMTLVVADILLHRLDVRLVRNIADILGDKLLDIDDRAEGDRLFQHAEHLLGMYIPAREQIAAVFPLGLADLRPAAVLLEKAAQARQVDGLPVLDEAVFRQHAGVDKEMVAAAAVAAAVEHDAAHKAAALRIIIKLAGDIARKILSAARARIVLVHVGAQITVQRALRALVRGEIEVPRVGLAEEHDLERVDDGGLAGAVPAGQKVHVPYLDQLPVEIQPVNQQYFLQLLHRRSPPFSAQPPPRAVSPRKRRSEWSAEWQSGSPADCICPRCAG